MWPHVLQRQREMSKEMKCGRLKYPPVEQLRRGRQDSQRYTQCGWRLWIRKVSRVRVYVHAQDHNVWNIYKDTEVFHLETVIVYNFSPLFWAQSGFDMFLQCQKRGGGFSKVQLRNRVPLKAPWGIEEWAETLLLLFLLLSSEVEDVTGSVETMSGPWARCKLMKPTCFPRKTIFMVFYEAGKNATRNEGFQFYRCCASCSVTSKYLHLVC